MSTEHNEIFSSNPGLRRYSLPKGAVILVSFLPCMCPAAGRQGPSDQSEGTLSEGWCFCIYGLTTRRKLALNKWDSESESEPLSSI